MSRMSPLQWDQSPSGTTVAERQALRQSGTRPGTSGSSPSPSASPPREVSPREGSPVPRAGSRPRTGGGGRRNRRAVTYDKIVRAPPRTPAQAAMSYGGDGEHSAGYLLYAAFEFKAHIKDDEALELCTAKVDKLVAQLRRCHPPNEARGHLIFDIIATRKHIRGLSPLNLGRQIYKVVDRAHFDFISTAFVGLTDNPACRVGRDIYARSEELSPRKDWRDFDNIDNVRMMIVYP
eukprot:Hpha_TRINITY_DN28542_c0_g1::TRINITY_DN28542_c0_g1_i1::g.18552::m.18552